MSVTEIINRQSGEYDLDEMILVVEHYIYTRTNKNVKINFDELAVNPFIYLNQVNKLSTAFDTAKNYLLNI